MFLISIAWFAFDIAVLHQRPMPKRIHAIASRLVCFRHTSTNSIAPNLMSKRITFPLIAARLWAVNTLVGEGGSRALGLHILGESLRQAHNHPAPVCTALNNLCVSFFFGLRANQVCTALHGKGIHAMTDNSPCMSCAGLIRSLHVPVHSLPRVCSKGCICIVAHHVRRGDVEDRFFAAASNFFTLGQPLPLPHAPPDGCGLGFDVTGEGEVAGGGQLCMRVMSLRDDIGDREVLKPLSPQP